MPTTVPSTTWAPRTGDGEYSLVVADNIVDASGNRLVDASGVFVVDSDSDFTPVPTTTWSENDGS